MQIHAADDHVRKMSGLVVVVVGGGGVGGQNMVKANEGMKVVGCEGVSRLPRQSRHNRHAWTSQVVCADLHINNFDKCVTIKLSGSFVDCHEQFPGR